jgi:beta-lactamase class A
LVSLSIKRAFLLTASLAVIALGVGRLAGADSAPLNAVAAGPMERHLEWVVTHLSIDGFSAVGDDELREHFDSSFLRAVPPDQFREVSKDLVSQGPYSLESFERPPTETEGVAILATPSGGRFRLSITLESSPPHRMTGLVIRLAPDLGGPVASSWEEFDRKLKPLASRIGFLAAEIKGERLEPIHDVGADTPLALGSTFKLYVLGEIARQVRDGKATWEENLTIENRLKSLPSGDMRTEEAGSKFSIRHYSEKMISVSDNTATDHLLFRVGRTNIENFQRQMGHVKPQLNAPFMSTREMFQLKLGPDEEAREYIDADTGARREILDNLAKRELPSLSEVRTWKKPRYIQDLEWFASPNDTARALLTLKTMSDEPELDEVRRILSLNPGLPFDRLKWKYVGFKGGSELGVLNMTWLLGRADGSWFILTVGLNDDSKGIDSFQVSNLMLTASTLISK